MIRQTWILVQSISLLNTQDYDCSVGISVEKYAAMYGWYTANAIKGVIDNGDGYIRGVVGNSKLSSPVDNNRSYGVRGVAGNCTDGYNYGIYGKLAGDNEGAGVFGTTNGDCLVDSVYAGYFYGPVEVTGELTMDGALVQTSDKRLKKNILSLNADSALEKVLQLHPVSYQLKKIRELDYQSHDSDTGYVPRKVTNPALLNRNHIGLVAQDLKKIYPELVYTKNSGVMGINYTGLIPVLIQAVKEQQNRLAQKKSQITRDSMEIETLKDRVASLEEKVSLIQAQCCNGLVDEKEKSKRLKTATEPRNSNQSASLYQNRPNPFTQATEIGFYLPEEIEKAILYIYDMQGKPVKQYSIAKRGDASKTIQGGTLNPGMYLYTLIADGKEVDTKKMILTN